MSRYWKAALPFLLAAVIILAAASRPVVLHIGFPCDSYWNVPGENYYTFIDAAIEKFEAEHPNVKVEYTSGIRVEDYTEWLSGQYLLGQEPDVMVILPEDFAIFSDTASLRELDPFMKQDPEVDLSGFYPAALQAGADKGKQYALPLECVPQMMFINKTLLQKEHIRIPDNDWTWDEFYSLCEQLTRDTDGDGIVDQFGVYDYGWEEALVANGCSLFSEDGQHCLLNQSAQESAMQFARQIYQLNAGTDLSDKTFDEGRVAFRPMLFSEYRSYEPYPWRIKRSSNFEWDCIAMPSGTSAGGGNYSRLSTLMLGIPLFILAGNLMNSCGITKRLMRFANACTGHMYGNIGQVSCLMSTLMGGVSGSAVADASMECRILGPEMTRLGYDRGWSAAINGLSGLIVATIPPSMGLIIYGTVGEVSIGRLFMAGWVPGILMCVLLMLAVTWSARRFGYKPEHDHPAPLSEILKALLDSIWAILFPVLLIVLIRFGIMSPTESGSFACAYALLVGTVFYHELTWESLLQTLRDSVKDITVITIILAFSGVFGYGIVFDNITVTIANALLGITSNSAILLLLVVVFLLICGMFMETTVIALILTPILLPVMRSIGVNEVVFGMIMMTTVTFGVMTPPVGTALYAVSDIMECPIEETFKKGWPFYLAIIGVILFMIFFPQAVLFLPNLVYGA